MYSFERSSRRKTVRHTRILIFIIFVLVILLAAITYSWLKARNLEGNVRDILLSRAISEAADAQSAAYRLTQSSGTNAVTHLANVRSHIYCLDMLNTLTSNLYGAGTVIVDPALLSSCVTTLDQSDLRLQAGNVMTDLYTLLRDQVNEVAATFNLN